MSPIDIYIKTAQAILSSFSDVRPSELGQITASTPEITTTSGKQFPNENEFQSHVFFAIANARHHKALVYVDVSQSWSTSVVQCMVDRRERGCSSCYFLLNWNGIGHSYGVKGPAGLYPLDVDGMPVLRKTEVRPRCPFL